MKFLVTWLLRLVVLLVLVIILVPIGLVVALNSRTGRDFVVKQVNQRSGGLVHVDGLAGVSVADKDGVWLTGSDLELRWLPKALFSRRLHIISLTADTLEVARAPVAGSAAAEKKSSGGENLYHFRAVVDHVAVRQLGVGEEMSQASQEREGVGFHQGMGAAFDEGQRSQGFLGQ